MNCPPSTLLSTNVHPVSIYNPPSPNPGTLEKIMAASDWRKELLCKHDSFRGSCCFGITRFGVPPAFQVTLARSGKEFSGSRFGFAFPVPGRFRKTCFIVLITKGKQGIVRFRSFWFIFVHGPLTKTGNPSFSGKLLVVIPGSFSGNLKRHVSCQEGRWFSVSISSKRVYIYMFLLHCKHFCTCSKI